MRRDTDDRFQGLIGGGEGHGGVLTHHLRHVMEEAGDDLDDLEITIAEPQSRGGGDPRVCEEAFERAQMLGAGKGRLLGVEAEAQVPVLVCDDRGDVVAVIAAQIHEGHDRVVAPVHLGEGRASSAKIYAKLHTFRVSLRRASSGAPLVEG